MTTQITGLHGPVHGLTAKAGHLNVQGSMKIAVTAVVVKNRASNVMRRINIGLHAGQIVHLVS
eukprot:CAMPEP_0172691452 /NCGR_PEP_ID=MMETSP1074-20121228/24566_1 /TAXON_ID=2916 /ORGANISM="Ceratium fusus, Strain PA161109" /LENGTH=62 /DNA_ID=CAMNT_0013511527 /DNA_START=43 /DNA_END=227 /DNA_ORIENTATION=-